MIESILIFQSCEAYRFGEATVGKGLVVSE
jgi:hypothetical protein